jgi:hypothetical protein
MWMNNGASERSFYRGGSWLSGASDGVFSLFGNNHRSISLSYFGLRAAYVDEDQ